MGWWRVLRHPKLAHSGIRYLDRLHMFELVLKINFMWVSAINVVYNVSGQLHLNVMLELLRRWPVVLFQEHFLSVSTEKLSVVSLMVHCPVGCTISSADRTCIKTMLGLRFVKRSARLNAERTNATFFRCFFPKIF